MCSHPVAGTDPEIQYGLLCNHWGDTFVLLIAGGRACATAFAPAPFVDWNRANEFVLSMRTSYERLRSPAGEARGRPASQSYSKAHVLSRKSCFGPASFLAQQWRP